MSVPNRSAQRRQNREGTKGKGRENGIGFREGGGTEKNVVGVGDNRNRERELGSGC